MPASSKRKSSKTTDKSSKKSKKYGSSSSSQPTFSSSGSGSGSGSSGSHSSSSGSKKASSSAEGSNETGTVQTVELEPSRPGLYKRIACIRYVRPMMPCMYDSWGCPMQMPFGGYGCYNSYGCAGEFPPSTRALIIPPKSKNLYRPARDEDFESNLKNFDVTSSFLKIRVPDDPSVGTMKLPSLMKTLPMQHRSKPKPIPPPHISKPKPLPPPPPPPKKKPIVDKSHLLKKYLHESKSTIQPKHKKKLDTHFRKKSERSNQKKKEEPAKVEKKEEKKVEKEAPKPKPPKVEKKSEPVKKETSSSSSSSSVKTPSDDIKFRNSDAREHHFDSAVKRRGSSFDAVVSHSYQVKSSQYDPVAPMGNMDNTKRKSDYQTMPSSANPSQFDSSKNASATILYNKGLPPEPPL